MHVHIALVSDQVLPTLIPALSQRPDLVVLACSEAMKAKGLDRFLAAQLSRHGIASDVRHGVPEVGLRNISAFAIDLLIDLQEKLPGDLRLTLNATGGTKLMAMAFIEELRADVDAIVYTDTAHRRLEVLYERDAKEPAAIPLDDVLKVHDYLSAQGFKAMPAAAPDEEAAQRVTRRKAAAKYLGTHADALGDFIQKMNGCMSRALDEDDQTVINPHIQFDHVSRRWAEALDQLAKAGVIEWAGGDSTEFTLMSAEAGRFIKGGWLEEYAWHVVRDERVFDCRLNVKGHWSAGAETPNEFDVLACHANQLLFVECKTLAFTKGREDNDLAYKIDSLGKQASGLFGRTWLLSARQPSEILIERARQARFDIVGPAELKDLRSRVRKWMAGPAI